MANEQWHMNEVWDVIEGHDPAGIDRGEIIQKAVLLYAALLVTGDIDTAPDWVRIVHNMELDDDGRPVDLPAVLDVAMARLKDGE